MLSPFLTRRPKMKKPYDNDRQAHLVYYLERFLIGQSLYTYTDFKHMQEIVKHACRYYKVRRPKLRIVTKGNRIFGQCFDDRIELNVQHHGRNIFTLLHELAHWIHHEKHPDDESHGPRFVGYYIDLLDRYKVMPDIAMIALCEYHGVEWGDIDE